MSVEKPLGYIPLHAEEEILDIEKLFVAFDEYDRVKAINRSTVVLAYPGDGVTTTARYLLRTYQKEPNTLAIPYTVDTHITEYLTGNGAKMIKPVDNSDLLINMGYAMITCLAQQRKDSSPWIATNMEPWAWWIEFWCKYFPHSLGEEKGRISQSLDGKLNSTTENTSSKSLLELRLDRLFRDVLLPKLSILGIERVVFLVEGFSDFAGSTKGIRAILNQWLGNAKLHNLHYRINGKSIQVVWKFFIPIRLEKAVQELHTRQGAEFDIVELKWSPKKLKDLLLIYSINSNNYYGDVQSVYRTNLISHFNEEKLENDEEIGDDPIQYRLILMATLQNQFGRLRALSLLTRRLHALIDRHGGLNTETWKEFIDIEVPVLLPSIAPYNNHFNNSHLIAVGADKYTSLTKLSQAGNDAKELKDLLEQKGYSELNMHLFTDETPKIERSKDRILGIFSQIKEKVSQKDTIIFFFAGHGKTGQGLEESRLCLWDYSEAEPQNASISATELNRHLRDLVEATGVKVLAILDCCHAGNFINTRTPADESTREPLESIASNFSSGHWNLLASTLQIAHEDPKLGHGYFSHYLLEGIKHPDSIDPNTKCISLFRLYAYVERKMNTRRGQAQKSISRIHHDMPLALARLYPFATRIQNKKEDR